MYAITATAYRRTADGWTVASQVPTFYLNANVQGIVDEAHAKSIALVVLGAGVTDDVTFHVTAVRV